MTDKLASMCLKLLSRDSLTCNCRLQSLEAVMIGIYQDFVVLILLLCPVMPLFLLVRKKVEKSHYYQFCVAAVTYMAAGWLVDSGPKRHVFYSGKCRLKFKRKNVLNCLVLSLL